MPEPDPNDPLKARLVSAIAPHAALYDALWRQDRLFRYAAWLKDGRARASRFPSAIWLRGLAGPFEPAGDITPAALEAECRLWADWPRTESSQDDVLEAASRTAQEEFRLDMAEALRLVTDPALTDRGLPIWNADGGCLFPAQLSSWALRASVDNESEAPGLGVTYRYEHPTDVGCVSLYLYAHGYDGVLPGIEDPRLRTTFDASLEDAAQLARQRGHSWQWVEPGIVETTPAGSGVAVPWYGAAWRIERPPAAPLFEALSVTGFRGRFLKVRCSILACIMESDAGAQLVDRLNSALADWIVSEGP